MIRINENDVSVNKFPDGTLLLKELISEDCGQEERKRKATITWLFGLMYEIFRL